MKPPTNKRLSRSYWAVGVRQAAVQAASKAFPQFGPSELGAALGLSRDQVRHYLHGWIKSGFNRQQPWVEPFFQACRSLSEGRVHTASDDFMVLSKMLAQLPPKPITDDKAV
jgi:hypothetical protein